MAAVGDCFSIGSIVLCRTCFDQTIEGEVLAFDQQTKMLILKCRTKNSEKLNDVYILNLQFCSDVQVKQEVSINSDTPQSLSLTRLRTRYRNAIDSRQRWADALQAGVSPEGQNLYMAVAKTFNENITWEGPNIVIFNEVTISPPYKIDNVTTCNPEKINLLQYVKKRVDQFFKSQAAAAAAAIAVSGNSSCSGLSSSSSTVVTNNNNNSSLASSTSVGTSSSNASTSPVPTI